MHIAFEVVAIARTVAVTLPKFPISRFFEMNVPLLQRFRSDGFREAVLTNDDIQA